jgi:BirA family biotin operon repressor/biotin-[acetyl-CoA-carboxylase] ligase
MGEAWTIERVATTGSTNADLIAAARAGAVDRTVLIADHQTAGRGRIGRTWEAPPGTNLLLSILFRSVPSAGPQRLTQQVAVAAARAAEQLSDVHPVLKWPNDLLVGDAKLAGVLAEAVGRDGAIEAVVVGIGLNLGWAPPGAARLEGVGRDQFAEVFLAELAALADRDDGGAAEYLARLDTLGRAVRVELPDGELTGVARSVQPDGRLVIEGDDGRERVLSVGDVVHLRS